MKKTLIQKLERRITLLFVALSFPFRKAIEWGRMAFALIVSFIVFALFLVSVDLINSIYPITGPKAIIISVIVIGIVAFWPKKYTRLRKLVVTFLVFANIMLVITTYMPGRKSTLISKWWHLDNSTRVEYEQGEDMSKNAMERFKDKEEILGKQADSCLKIFDFVGAAKFRDSLINEGENLKNDLARSDSIKIRNKKKYEEQPKLQQVVYQPPIPPQWSVEKIGDNKVRVHFVPNCTIPTGLEFKSGDTYRFLNPSAPFDVAGSRKPFYTITGNIDFEAKQGGEIYVYGCGYDGVVEIEVLPS